LTNLPIHLDPALLEMGETYTLVLSAEDGTTTGALSTSSAESGSG
jgi:hypothetical protein